MTDPHRSLEELEAVPDLLWIDVRTPSEHAQGHIPGALNLPILDDAERARVGIEYAQQGAMAAKLLGMNLVGPRLGPLVKRYSELAEGRPIALYCWRGGMRSGLIGRLLHDLGIPVSILRGGYRAHRHEVMSHLETRIPPLVVLHGHTGSGKTILLRRLAARFPVIDLEGLGSHRGSTFGDVGLPPQPTQLQFESALVQVLRRLPAGRPVLVEGESPALGVLKLPLPLIRAMRSGWRVILEVPRALRVRLLVEEYGPVIRGDTSSLARPLTYLKGRLPTAVLASLSEALAAGQLDTFCELLLERHYDALYERWSRRGGERDYRRIAADSLEQAEHGIAAALGEIDALFDAGARGPELPPLEAPRAEPAALPREG